MGNGHNGLTGVLAMKHVAGVGLLERENVSSHYMMVTRVQVSQMTGKPVTPIPVQVSC